MKIIENYTDTELQQIADECCTLNEFLLKIGYSNHGAARDNIKNYCKEHKISIEHFTNHQPLNKKIPRDESNIFIKDSTVGQHILRKVYKENNYSEYKCAICGMEPFWNGQEITLTLDHINGDNKDNRLENLRWVCPNCDRQLPTFCGRNKRIFHKYYPEEVNSEQDNRHKNFCQSCGIEISKGSTYCLKCHGELQRKVTRPSPEELKQILLDNNGNFTEVGRIFGVNDNSIRKWCKAYDMPYHSDDYKNDIKQPRKYHKRLNYLQVVELYKEKQNITKVADELNADVGTISDILKACNIEVKTSGQIAKEQQGKKINMFDKQNNFICSFNSAREAGLYLYENKITQSSDIKGIASHITQVCSGQRKSAYGYLWKFI